MATGEIAENPQVTEDQHVRRTETLHQPSKPTERPVFEGRYGAVQAWDITRWWTGGVESFCRPLWHDSARRGQLSRRPSVGAGRPGSHPQCGWPRPVWPADD